MFRVEQDESEFTCELSSKHALVDRAVGDFSLFLGGLENGADLSDITGAIRELLINALEHGNRGDAALPIRFAARRIAAANYLVEISDRGNGFDSGALLAREELAPSQVRTRGLAIVNAVADHLEADGKGTIKAWFTVVHGTELAVVRERDAWGIRPSGDISASIADGFRKLLVDWYESGSPSLVLDFGKVANIDSIGLSILVSLAYMPKVRERLRTVAVRNVQPSIQRLFVLTRLHVVFRSEGI